MHICVSEKARKRAEVRTFLIKRGREWPARGVGGTEKGGERVQGTRGPAKGGHTGLCEGMK